MMVEAGLPQGNGRISKVMAAQVQALSTKLM